VVNFSDEAFIDQELNLDVNKLRDGWGNRIPRGTALYDAWWLRRTTWWPTPAPKQCCPDYRRRRQRLDPKPGADHPARFNSYPGRSSTRLIVVRR